MSSIYDAQYAYTFDDLILIPQSSTVESRQDPDIRVSGYKIPVITAPMNTVTEHEMAQTMIHLGGDAVIHRFMSIEDALEQVKLLDGVSPYFALGANGDFKERGSALYKAGVRKFCVDVANGYTDRCLKAVQDISKAMPEAQIMSGNVCTEEGALALAEAGASVIRVGIGPGAVCKTRLVTGHGLPQLSAIEWCCGVKSQFPNVVLVADGGIRSSGDIVKALAAGADMVMIGSLLAATKESPGEVINIDERLYKYYHGMASEEGREKWFDRSKSGFVPEGISIKLPYTGKTAEKVIEGLMGGLKSGMTYTGAHDLQELKKKAKWARQTPAGYIEGTPHGRR